MPNLKSQILSLQGVIAASIILIILIVSWVIFVEKIGSFTKEVASCRNACIEQNECKYPKGVEAQEKCPKRKTLKAGYYEWSPFIHVCCVLLDG